MSLENFDKQFIETLKERFESNMHRHKFIKWEFIINSLERNLNLYNIVKRMEDTGGQPDIIDIDAFNGLVFADMSKESPSKRRDLCYDKEARLSRKKNPPVSSAMEEAEKIGIKLLNEEQYYALAELEDIDSKTSSWIFTEPEIRNLGGALFSSKKYNRTFTYHNSAESYYQSRGFRGYIKIWLKSYF